MRWSVTVLVLVLLAGVVSAAPHQHAGFSVAESFSVNGRSVSVDDTAVYRTAYYARDGDVEWTPFELSGSDYPGNAGWLTGEASFDIPALSGEYYVIAYSCTWNGVWDCHDGMWQLIVLGESVPLDGLASFDFESAAGGSLEGGASLTTDAVRGSVLSPNGGLFRVPDGSADVIGDFSLSAWVWLDSSADVSKIVVKPTNGIVDPYELYALDVRDGDIRFVLTDGAPYAVGDWAVASAPISLGEWHHVVGTYDGGTMRLYLDGALVDSETLFIDVAESGEDLLIGSYIDDYSLDGLIDEVVLFDRALSATEVVELFGGEVPVGCSGSSSQPCDVLHGSGSRSRTCSDGDWSDWTACSVISCTDGYHISDNSCVEDVVCDSRDHFSCDPVTGDVYWYDSCNQRETPHTVCTASQVCTGNVCLDTGNPEDADFYVAPWGDDSDPGSFERPWKTLKHAIMSSAVRPGDLVYLRGGVYEYESDAPGGWRTGTKSGEQGNRIRYFNYPGETPIIDGSSFQHTVAFRAITSHNSHMHFKGLVFRNFHQRVSAECSAWEANGRDLIFENMVFHAVDGHGLTIGTGYDVHIINSDAYDCADPEWIAPGEQGSGFAHSNPSITDTSTYFYGCRAWNCSDQGFATFSQGYVEYDHCWSMDNGRLVAGGSGFKLGGFRHPSSSVIRVVKNSIAVNNRLAGFNTNDEAGSDTYSYPVGMNVYNNFAYHDGSGVGNIRGYSFYIRKPEGSTQELEQRIFRNNLAYSPNGYAQVYADGAYTHDHNIWDTSGIAVSAVDFVNLDVNQLYRDRKADGSLPDIMFGKLAEGSDLIDAGMITNLHCSSAGAHPGSDCIEWYGDAPDISWHESNY